MFPNFTNLSMKKGTETMALPLLALEIGAVVQPKTNANLNYRGPQSTRPLPRWYWWSNKQARWRRFDNFKTDTSRNDTLEQLSEKKGGLKPGMVVNWPPPHGGGVTIVKWDVKNREGVLTFKAGGAPIKFERLSQRDAVEVQANNFVYDHSGLDQPNDRMLADNAHVVPMFRNMLEHELKLAKTHVFMYHSYYNVSLIYDLGACLMRVAFPDEVNPNNRDAIVPRTDRSTFNNRSPAAVVANFKNWYNDTDVAQYNPETRVFPWIGVSTVLNCFKTNPESTIVHDFKQGYNPGDSPNLNPVLSDLLDAFKISSLRDKLLQLTIEADVDVTSFLGKEAHFFFRKDPTQPWEVSNVANTLEEEFEDFMEYDDQLGPLTKRAYGYTVELRRDGPGMQAYGTATPDHLQWQMEVLTVTKNPGRYLQLAIPLTLVDELAYAALPFGHPDTDPTHALSHMDERTDLLDGGQARLIARPDLIWRPDVVQTVYQFSRAAAKKRIGYLTKIETLLRDTLGKEGMRSVGRKLRPAPIVVRSHNVWYKNKEPDKIVTHLSSKAKYSFACLQEATSYMLTALAGKLPDSHTLLYDHACGAKKVYAAMVYHSGRFQIQGSPYYGCFKLDDGKTDAGRPFVGAVFLDEWVGRRLLVLSIHAPHNNKTPYKLMKNLQFFVDQTLTASGVKWNPGLAHVVIAGDFNRSDWQKKRELSFSTGTKTSKVKLSSAQGMKGPDTATYDSKAIDNILFASRRFRYELELNKFYAEDDKHGADHKAVMGEFLC